MEEYRIGLLIMAAGNAQRFGQNKLAAELDGKSLIEYALDSIPTELFCKRTVVTQYPEIEKSAKQRGFVCVKNEHPDWGISHTIFLGTSEMMDCDGIVYLVSDQPLLKRDSIARIVNTWKNAPEKIVGACHDGVRGNPNLFPSRFFEELLNLNEDHGGNTVIRNHPDDFLGVEVEQKELTDCDTPQALEEIKKEK